MFERNNDIFLSTVCGEETTVFAYSTVLYNSWRVGNRVNVHDNVHTEEENPQEEQNLGKVGGKGIGPT